MYAARAHAAHRDPAALEALHREAVGAGDAAAFAQAIEDAYAADPDNLLLGAWHYRLAERPDRRGGRAIAWPAAIGLAVLNGTVLWGLSADQLVVQVGGLGGVPVLAFLWAPVSAVFVMAFLVAGGQRRPAQAGLLAVGIVALGLYPLWAGTLVADTALAEQYALLSVLHLALLAWAATGLFVLVRGAGAANGFAFLARSLQVFVAAGLLAIAGAIFTVVTVELFSALAVELPTEAVRLLVAGGAGLIPVLAVALVYDPSAAPSEQPVDDGLGRVVATLMRLLLPLTLAVLAIYVALIPFRFSEPFQDRDVLLVYNVTVFAIVALLIGATPATPDGVAPALRRWLRGLLVAVALLAIVVSVYELAAIVYRTLDGGFTINRLTILGWNLVNTAVLGTLLAGQSRASAATWIQSMQRAFWLGMPLYAGWGLFVVLAIPWLFR